MRAHFFWPGSRFHPSTGKWDAYGRGLFWVSATMDEAKEHLSPLMTEEGRTKFNELDLDPNEVYIDQAKLTDTEHYMFEDKVYFIVPAWIPEDGSDPVCHWIRIYPYSGMWNGRRPWIPIGAPKLDHPVDEPTGIKLPSIKHLDELPHMLRHAFYLTPRAHHKTGKVVELADPEPETGVSPDP